MSSEEIVLGILNDTYICTHDGYAYFLGPQADKTMTWHDAITWCESLGNEYELPNKDVLEQCYKKQEIKTQFNTDFYWSSSEYSGTYSWYQTFNNGDQYGNNKNDSNYVRAVRRLQV